MVFKENKIKGFTLIELLVVISIIGLLSSIIFVGLNSTRAKARDAKRLASIRQVQTALEMYYDANGLYPIIRAFNTSGGDGSWLTDLATTLRPYIGSLPNDATAVGYIYSSTNSGQKYGLAVNFESPSYNALMTGDGSIYASYYELGSSPADCSVVGKDWYVAGTSTNCP